MPSVNEAKAQQKWDALQKASSRSLDKLMSGDASPADVRSAATTIGRFDQLARQIFLDGIAAVEAQADQYRDQINRDLVAKGEKPLSNKKQKELYDETFNSILKEQIPDIIGMVQDAVRESTKETIEDDPQFGNQLKTILGSVLKEHGVSNQLDEDNGKSPFDAIKNLTGGNAVLALDSDTEAAIVTALQKQNVFHDEVIDTLGIIKSSAEEDEGKKADSWFRRMKAWFGDKYDKVKKKASSNWVKTLLAGLLLAITNPQLIIGLIKKVKELINFDTIGKFLSDAWQNVKNEGSSMVDSVLEMVGLKKSKEQLEKERFEGKKRAPEVIAKEDHRIAMLEQQIANAKRLQQYDKEHNRPVNRKNEAFLANAPDALKKAKEARAKQVELLNSTGPLDKLINSANPNQPPNNTNINVRGGNQTDSTTQITPAFNMRSNSVFNAPSNVSVQPAAQLNYDPTDLTNPANGFNAPPAAAPTQQPQLKTTNMMGLGSFSMTPGIGEHLQILNMSSLT